MKVRMMLHFPLIFLLMACGVFGEDWNVIYENKSICAPKGSTVNLTCTYKYPEKLTLTDTFWIMCEKQNKPEDIQSLKEYSEYKDRVEYFEDKEKKKAVLRLHNVTENDERAYCFRLVTNTEGQKWIGKEGVKLAVSALQVKAPQLVLEKQTVNLTCETTCSLTDGFICYNNGQTLTIQSETLQLQSERSDSGHYSCAARGHEHLPSPAVSITVMYHPQNVSVSISPSGVIVEGDSVTLNCSSDSNPPAEISWFKENQSSAVGSGQSFSISSFNASHSGRFYCEAQNKHGSQRSASVSVTVKGVWNIMYIIGVCATVIAAGFGLFFLIIIIIMYKRKKIKNNDSQDTDNHLNGSQDIEQKKVNQS
ncbi:sialoadhesin-like [Cyprinus carpio]|uniref:Sialoadhesin-like n=1 Tax=Cyprinus carpio TaxID=7962 RepID=A0A9Q9YHJ7_CYPCA|nr:sialoadhesin-like [Cyprinus carpio]